MATRTLELKAGGQSTKPSKLGPSVYLTVVFTLLSWRVMAVNSFTSALIWTLACLGFWILMETQAVTQYLHRFLTHGAIRIVNKWLLEWFMWWTRSGMVKDHEWVEDHANHHENTDNEHESYTPNAFIIDTNTQPLRPPRPWRILDNARSYTRRSQWFNEHPEELDRLAEEHPNTFGAAMQRLAENAWSRGTYDKVGRALLINWGIFTIIAMPMVRQAGGWYMPFVMLALPWAMIGIKAYLYLLGGYIINYYGHLAGRIKRPRGEEDLVIPDVAHQANVPWWLMLLTLFMMGEGWHEFHHDAPFGGRFHWLLDPGWWFIWPEAKLGLVDNITVAKRNGPRGSRDYSPRAYNAWRFYNAAAA